MSERKRGYVHKIVKGWKYRWGIICEEGGSDRRFFFVMASVVGGTKLRVDDYVEFCVEPKGKPTDEYDRAVRVAVAKREAA